MDPFQVLGIPRRYDVDLAAVARIHRELSRALHPDRFAAAGASERRASLEKATEVNEAFRVITDPVRRAEALFALAGVATGETREPKPTPAFLMDVMEQREALVDARVAKDEARVALLGREMSARSDEAMSALASGFARGGDVASLLPRLGELRFYRRFLEEVAATVDEWENG